MALNEFYPQVTMDFKTSKDERYQGQLKNMSYQSGFELLRSKLTDDQKTLVHSTCFGYLLDFSDLTFTGQLIHNVLLREVEAVQVGQELWFMVSGDPIQFSCIEFGLIMGLKFGHNKRMKKDKRKRLFNEYFGGKDQITPKQLDQWNVKELIPHHYNMHRNNKRITAKDLFDKQHKEQLKDAQNWMKDTSESFSTVSILVATVVFAASYTVPGGNNDNDIPVFLYAPLFWVFTIMDVVSLISSLPSLAMFLSILTAPLKPEAFLKSIPSKMMIVFGLLGFSVLSSMTTFAAALLLLIRLKKRWTTFLVYVTVFIPVVAFAGMQFPLYSALLNSLFDKFKCTPRKKKKDRYEI